MYTSVDRKLDFSSGAATLLLRLDESVQQQANLWQQAIKWNLAYLSEEDLKKAQNIKSWYDFEKSFSYSSEKYRLKPDKALLLQKHRDDHNYIFKNIVEMLVRKLLKDYFTAKWIDAKLYTTSDADDALAGIDIVVEIDNNIFGIDVCCSENENTLEKKTKRSLCHPVEYNLSKKANPMREIPRVVYPIPRDILSRFLDKAMTEISQTGNLARGRALNYFQSHTRENKKDPFENIIGEFKTKLQSIF